MNLLAFVPIFALLTGCGSKLVADKPAPNEIVGVWECSEFPSGFLREVGSADGTRMSQLAIRDDGTCTASNFPQRTPYRFIDVAISSWTLTDPSMTPSGAWSIEFDGNFLQCRRAGEHLELRYLISGKDEYSVNYKRQNKNR
jgi:hypothetical protein